jgi:V/A-type H+-transporting ATPase subunit I
LKKKDKKEKTGKKLNYTPVKKIPLRDPTIRVEFDAFNGITEREDELFGRIAAVEEGIERQNALTQERNKLLAEIAAYKQYEDIHIPFGALKDTERTAVLFGNVPSARADALNALTAEFADDAVFETFTLGPVTLPFAVVVVRERLSDLSAALQGMGFVAFQAKTELSSAECIQKLQARIEEIDGENRGVLEDILQNEKFNADIMTLYDYYSVENEKYDAIEGLKNTEKAFVLSAWFPREQEERLKAIVDGVSEEFVYEFCSPEEQDAVPTLVRSPKIVEPYQDITNLYSVPNYSQDMDPNPLMSFFYFLFFGMMLADAGYGLLLAIGGFALYKWRKPAPGKGKLILIIAMGGVSTIIWGVLFGGWFGLDISGTPLSKAMWFNPLDDPLTMLILSVAMGVVQVAAGMVVSAINKFRHKRPLDAIFDDLTWVLVFIGLGLAVLGMAVVKNSALQTAGFVAVGVGLAAAVVGNAKGKKGVKGKIKGAVGGLGKLYNSINILSDVLSYTRLFGLGLCGGVIALVVNKLCETLMSMLPIYIAIIPVIAVFIIGHIFNVAISTLSAYIHDSRLQYIEYFGKFYNGAGRKFSPIGTNTKYTYVLTDTKQVAQTEASK